LPFAFCLSPFGFWLWEMGFDILHLLISQIVKLLNWQVDKLTNWEVDKLTKWEVDK
jgi:hypothetical protein